MLVAFEHGDPRRPYVLGALWSKVDQPPPDDGDPTQNNWRFFRSRSGHMIRFDDTQGAEKIEIDRQGRQAHDRHRQRGASSIESHCDERRRRGRARQAGKVTIEATTVDINATRRHDPDAPTGRMTIKGATVDINLRSSAMGQPAAKQGDQVARASTPTSILTAAGPTVPVPCHIRSAASSTAA